jgi:hypothetical protein
MAVDRNTWPVLVRIGLWGRSTRALAWISLVLCVVVAICCFAFDEFMHYQFLGGVVLVIAAVWYFLSIRWVDKNSSWQ